MIIRICSLLFVLTWTPTLDASPAQDLAAEEPSTATADHNSLQVLFNSGHLSSAEQQLQKQYVAAKKHGDQRALARSLHDLAHVNLLKNQYTDALAHFQNALAISEQTSGNSDIANLYTDIGRTYRLLGMHQQALTYFSQAKDIYHSLNDQRGIALEQLEVGIALGELGQFENALRQLKRALPIFRQLRASELTARTQMAIARTYSDINDKNVALTFLRDAASLIDTLPNLWLKAELGYNTGILNLALANYKTALRHLKTSFAIFQQFDAPCDIDKVNAAIGALYYARGDIEQGIQLLNDTLEHAVANQCNTRVTALHLALAKMNLTLDHAATIAHVQQGMAIATSRNDLLSMAAFEGINVLLFEAQGNFAKALQAMKSRRKLEQENTLQRRSLELQYLQSQLNVERQAQSLSILNQSQTVKLVQAEQDELQIRMFYASLLVSLLIVFLVWSRFNQRHRARVLRKEVKRRTQELEEKNTELESAYSALERASLLDPLTGLYNRQFLNNQLPQEIQRAQQAYMRSDSSQFMIGQSDIMCFLLDIDDFKAINDTYGHLGGDRVLVELGNVLRTVFRPSDILIRWGGEEFLCVCRNTSRDDAVPLAERLQRSLHEHRFNFQTDTPLKVTCSIGFCVLPLYPSKPTHLDWSGYFALIDECLYAAKHSGKDCWVGLVGEKSASTSASARSPLEKKYSLPPTRIHTSLNHLSAINWACG